MIHGEGNKSTLVFSDEIDEEYNFDIRSGEVTIYIDNDMTLTNKNFKPARSAINIEPNATLNLYISENTTLTVDSGFGTQGATGHMGEMKQNEGGDGGFAGIRVPSTEEGKATLNLYGEGTLIAIGGNATPGGAGTSNKEENSDVRKWWRRRSVERELGIGGNRRKRWGIKFFNRRLFVEP